ncbi:sigma-54 interaction domain-containing protein [Kaarinaea lacus]
MVKKLTVHKMATGEMVVGEAPCFEATMRAANLIAATDATLLIHGESGTGKELLAHKVHENSKRVNKPFISINCAALPEQLAESELFGHRKGAFTGAHANYDGRIRAAEGGTLFLDEVGELSLSIQAKLLRFLESGECQAIGENKAYHCDVRLIAATNRDLFTMVKAGQFREDLFYRLNVVPLEMPALRERASDLNLLLQFFTKQFSAIHELQAPVYSKAALKQLHQYHWPGNVRELRNFCERMLILFSGRQIELQNLPQEISFPAHATLARQADGFILPDDGVKLEDLEIDIIKQALHKARGNRSRVARLLGLTRDTLLYRIKKYAINC